MRPSIQEQEARPVLRALTRPSVRPAPSIPLLASILRRPAAAPSVRCSIHVVSGDGQVGLPGRALDVPLIVRVVGDDGLPLEGIELLFEVAAGGGYVLGSGWAATDVSGLASVRAVLGPERGPQLISASAAGANATFAVFASGEITTIAGDGVRGGLGDGGPAPAAHLHSPFGLAVDSHGCLHVADYHNHRVRRLDPTGTITTIAGTGAPGFDGDGGPATAARLNGPVGLAIDANDNLYIADHQNDRVRRVDAITGELTTVAGCGLKGCSGDGGPATQACIGAPLGLAIDPAGNLFISAWYHHVVRRVEAATGAITTHAGTGAPGDSGDGDLATRARLNLPHGLATDAAGNLFIADQANHRLRRVDGADGTISTVAGDGTPGFAGDGGPAAAARLRHPSGVTVDHHGNVHVGDAGNYRVRRIDTRTTTISTVAGDGRQGSAGDGGPALNASLDGAHGLAMGHGGELFIAEHVHHRVRKVPLRGRAGLLRVIGVPR